MKRRRRPSQEAVFSPVVAVPQGRLRRRTKRVCLDTSSECGISLRHGSGDSSGEGGYLAPPATSCAGRGRSGYSHSSAQGGLLSRFVYHPHSGHTSGSLVQSMSSARHKRCQVVTPWKHAARRSRSSSLLWGRLSLRTTGSIVRAHAVAHRRGTWGWSPSPSTMKNPMSLQWPLMSHAASRWRSIWCLTSIHVVEVVMSSSPW